jgi:hypothetical protein
VIGRTPGLNRCFDWLIIGLMDEWRDLVEGRSEHDRAGVSYYFVEKRVIRECISGVMVKESLEREDRKLLSVVSNLPCSYRMMGQE